MKNKIVLACLLCNISLFASNNLSFGATTYNINTFSGGDGAILSRTTQFVNDDTLNFQNDITATSAIGSLGVFTLNVTGNSHSLEGIEATNAGFTIQAGSKYNFDGINFNNFTGTNNGNAINNAGIITLSNSNFSLNSSSNGGAIYNNGLSTIVGGVYSGNVATGSGAGIGGGAIYNASTKILNVSGATFSSNQATGLTSYGGAIYNAGTSTISDSIFNSNTSITGGGAIHNESTKVLNVINTTFTTNSSLEGGAIYNYGTATITGGSFSNNSATSSGGAIYSHTGSFLTISDAVFSSNKVTSATLSTGGALQVLGTTKITNTDFRNNSTISGNGGAIYSTGTLNIIGGTFENNSGANTKNNGGGAIAQNGGTVSIIDATFNSNTYSGAISYGGGAVHVQIGALKSMHNTYTLNSGNGGGALCFNNGVNFLSINDIFTQNSSTSSASGQTHGGGAIANSTGTVNIINGLFERNTGYRGGAILSNYMGTINVYGGSFSENTASGSVVTHGGGAIYTGGSSARANIYSALFDSNTTIGTISNGGAIYSIGGTLTVTNSIFNNNSAKTYGGAIYAHTASSYVNILANGGKTIFSGNKANNISNAVYMTAGKLNLNAAGSNYIVFDDKINSLNATSSISINKTGSATAGDPAVGAPTMGTIIFNEQVNNTTLNLYNGTLKLGENNNTKLTAANGITPSSSYLTNIALNLTGGNLDCANGNIDSNNLASLTSTASAGLFFDADLSNGTTDQFTTAGTATGALTLKALNIKADGVTSNLTLFTGAKSPNLSSFNAYTNGFKYAIAPNATAGVLDVVQSASANGLYDAIVDTATYRSFSAFDDTTVSSALGAIGGTSATMTMFGNQKNLNGSGNSGIIVDVGNTLNLYNVGSCLADGTFTTSVKNFSSTNGGFLNNAGTVNIYGGAFTNNTSTENGGAIYNTGVLNITDSLFANNSSGGTFGGGAIWNQGTLNLIGAVFKENSAGYGSVLRNESGSAILADSKFIGNTVTTGNGVVSNNAVLTLINSTFTGNTSQTGLTGAVANLGTLYIQADKAASVFSGNLANGVANDLYLLGGTTYLNAGNGGVLTFEGAITSSALANPLNINSTTGSTVLTNGTINFNSPLSTLTANIYDGIVNFGNSTIPNINQNNVTFNITGGIQNFTNNTFLTGSRITLNDVTPTIIESTNLIDSIFNDASYTGSGGTINMANGTLNLTSGTFLNNIAQGSGAGIGGGAIYSAGIMNTTGTSFTSNQATGATSYGGAIFNKGTATIKNSTFNMNTSKTTGGGIYNDSWKTLTLINTDFTTNSSGSGGAIGNLGTLTVTGGTYIGNTATGATSKGGAIYATSSTTITDANFSSNQSTGATSTGGAIYSSNIMNIANSSFSNNTTKTGGGGVFNDGTMTIYNCNFTNNSATGLTTWTGLGGAIESNTSKIMNITGGTFDSNTAGTVGGAIYIATYTTTNINNATFKNNTATINGGAILFDGGVNINGGSFNGNKANGSGAGCGGGAIYATARVVTSNLIGVSFDSNQSVGDTSYGGAIYNSSTHVMNITNSIFSNNSAKTAGGAIYNVGSLYIQANNGASTFTGNTVNGLANDLYLATGSTNYLNAGGIGSITFNGGITAQTSAVALNINSTTGSATLTDGTINFNHGFSNIKINDYAGTTNFGSSSILNVDMTNVAFLITGGVQNFTNNTFKSNSRITINDLDPTAQESVNLINSKFQGAAYTGSGGGINVTSGTLTTTNTDFSNYAATVSGGAIYNAGTTTLTGGTFTGNSATTSGGAIYNDTDKVLNSSANFETNSSALGGAIYNAGTTTLTGGTFTGNSATTAGGGLFNNTEKTLSVSNSTFNGNSSVSGGALYNLATATITNSTFTSNSSSGALGGAIYNFGSLTINADNGTTYFAGNTASGSSNAIYTDAGSILKLNAGNGGTIRFDDVITASALQNLDINSDAVLNNGDVIFNNSVNNFNINLSGGQLKLGLGSCLNNTDSLNLSGGILNLQNNRADDLVVLNNFSSTASSSLYIDVDFSTGINDKFSVASASGELSIGNINILADGKVSSLELFTGGIAPTLSAYEIFSSDYRYTFNPSSTIGVYDVITISYDGLNYAIEQVTSPRLFSVTRDTDAEYNFGTLGGINSTMTINGNNYDVNGIGYSGVNVLAGQTLNINNVKSWNGFINSASGGAINNSGSLNIASSTFYNNQSQVKGGAIFSDGATVVGGSTFNSNHAVNSGGAIYNNGALNINAGTAFVNNSVASASSVEKGGAIFNEAAGIMTIEGTSSNSVKFLGNYTSTSNIVSNGGAIYNLGTSLSNSISYADFKYNGYNDYNLATATASVVSTKNGGAIENGASANLTVSNSTFTSNGATNGGAIYNEGAINISNSNFENNLAKTQGGAIYNSGSIVIKDSDFSNNTAENSGGAIFNSSTGTVTINADTQDVNFTGNTDSTAQNDIYNAGVLNLNANGSKFISFAGKLSGNGTINVNSDSVLNQGLVSFNNNLTNNTLNQYGGTVSFVAGKSINLSSLNLYGGTFDIENGATDDLITLDNFTSTNAASIKFDADFSVGQNDKITAVSASGDLNVGNVNITADGDISLLTLFTGGISPTLNYFEAATSDYQYFFTPSSGTAGLFDVRRVSSAGLNSVIADAISPRSFSATRDTDAEYNFGTMGGVNSVLSINGNNHSINGLGYSGVNVLAGQALNINGVGVLNSDGSVDKSWNGFITASNGGAINSGGALNIANSVFSNNSSLSNGGAIYASDSTVLSNSVFIQNSSAVSGGAIYQDGGILTVENTVFKENNAQNGLGGAIYVKDALVNIIADGANTIFTSNKASGTSSAVYLESSSMNINAGNSGSVVFNDKIQSDDLSNVININKTGSTSIGNPPVDAPVDGNVYFNNSVSASAINMYSGTVNLAKDNYLDGNDMNFYGGTLNLANNLVGVANFNNLAVNGTTNLKIDADLANGIADKITSENQATGSAKLNVNHVNILSDANVKTINIPIADNNVSNFIQVSATEAESQLYKYALSYNPSTGTMGFVSSREFTNSVITPAVASAVGSFLNQSATYSEAIGRMDGVMFMPKADRLLMLYKNKTASVDGKIVFSPTLLPEESAGTWVKQYTTFENVPLNNGPNVSNVGYGMLIGNDSELQSLGHGYTGYMSAYVGYNGSHQNYENVGSYQNGGLLGLTGTVYKGNFFAALTGSAGASNGNNYTTSGVDNFTSITAGLALKTGYNFEMLRGKIIIQPSIMASYTFVNTFDYTSASGASITSDPINAIQLTPGLKIIGNLKDGWQPYIGANMVWNFMDSTKFYANDVQLPQLSVDPYLEYGFGIQRKWGDRFTGFGQAMARGGGRSGVALQFGFRWAI